ncbi:hypothetical protein KSS87_010857 [Heliosperma pusillum]|nr:hypothetical protein KSS87_010857 [Heliosperma pusillum]
MEEGENETSTSTTTAAQGGGGYNGENAKRARLNSTLSAMLKDPILSDVPINPTLSDVDILISLELGSAMRITVLKLDSTSFGMLISLSQFNKHVLCITLSSTFCLFLCVFADVVLMNNATLKDLKLAIKKKVNEMEQSKMGHRHISWKHVWANYCLLYHNEKLLNDSAPLQDFGVRNNSQVQFIPFIVARQSKKHTRRKKHRFFHGLNKLS